MTRQLPVLPIKLPVWAEAAGGGAREGRGRERPGPSFAPEPAGPRRGVPPGLSAGAAPGATPGVLAGGGGAPGADRAAGQLGGAPHKNNSPGGAAPAETDTA